MIKKLFKLVFVTGLGFVAGLLMAPVKGSEARQKVKEAADKGKAKFDEIKKKIGESGCCGGGEGCCQ